MKKNENRVMVAMSGGVDSSLTAALLLEQGYEVVGVTMQLWPSYLPPVENETGCCSITAVDDAAKVANSLGIPYYVLNLQEEFDQLVVKPFIQDYLQGLTPNPCILCNQYLKFSHLLRKAESLECQYLATGHYAQIKFDPVKGVYNLYRAMDDQKDQSYFLFRINQSQMGKVLFPLGGWTKDMVRKKAAEFKIHVSAKPDSQEICFITNNDYRDFLRRFAPQSMQKGEIVDQENKKLGTHEGIAFYTIGQRKGLGIYKEKPCYVIKLLPKENKVVVGENKDTFASGLIAKNVHWHDVSYLKDLNEVKIKIRYSAPLVEAKVYPQEDQVKVVFQHPQRAITPGQAVVFYQGEKVLGGAMITSSITV